MPAADVDLNLLRVLDALLEEGSVARAAVRLHLSAPAVSRSLGRLRRALEDPLFVRAGRGLVPTPRALELQSDVRDALEQATRVLTPGPTTFDPAAVERVFKISAGDAIVASVGFRLVATIRDHAPRSGVTFLPDTNEAELLRSNEVDLDLGSPHGLGTEIESEVLFSDRFVAVAHVAHPLAKQSLTTRRFARADHVVVSSKGARYGAVDRVLATHELARDSVTVVPSFVVAAHVVADGAAIAVLPSAVVAAFARRLPITAIDLPIDLPPLPVSQSWHRRNTNDPAHRWLRQLVRSVSPRSASGD